MTRRVFINPAIVDSQAVLKSVRKDTDRGEAVEFHNHPYTQICDGFTEGPQNDQHCWKG